MYSFFPRVLRESRRRAKIYIDNDDMTNPFLRTYHHSSEIRGLCLMKISR